MDIIGDPNYGQSEEDKAFNKDVNRVLGYVKRDIKNQIEWDAKTPAEKLEVFEQERKAAEEAKAAEAAKKKEEAEKKDEAQKIEDERRAELNKSYIVHTAVTKCNMGARQSYVVIPLSHGEHIHGIPQLNIGDSKPIVNIRTFGGCLSPKNPNVQEAAKSVLKDAKYENTNFSDKVSNFFGGKPKEISANDFKCVGECKPVIDTEWIDGQEDVLIEGKPALLGRCILRCLYDGEISLISSGQPEE